MSATIVPTAAATSAEPIKSSASASSSPTKLNPIVSPRKPMASASASTSGVSRPPDVININTTASQQLTFTLVNVNLSHANAIRRVILADIPTVVFDQITITENTTRLNNELIKQRLRCIPIHVQDTDGDDFEKFLSKKMSVTVNEENTGEEIRYVTTQHFQITQPNVEVGIAPGIATAATAATPARPELFKPFLYKGKPYFLDVARLRPRVANVGGSLVGDVFKMTATLKKATAKEDQAYNVASTCSYGFTVDDDKRSLAWTQEEKKLKTATEPPPTAAELEFLKKDWFMLEGKRCVKTRAEDNEPNSFDFIIESVGPFENKYIVQKAVQIIMQELELFIGFVTNNTIAIQAANTTMDECYDVLMYIPSPESPWTAGYTLGKVIEAELHELFFKPVIADESTRLTFCAFHKPHPHINDCYIRLAGQPKALIKNMLMAAAKHAIASFSILLNKFE